MRWLTLAMISWLAVAGSAVAETPTDSLCSPIQGEWDRVAGSNDLAAMDREITKIPPLCAALRTQAQRRRAAVARQRAQSEAASAAAQAERERAAREEALVREQDATMAADNAAYDIARAGDSVAAYDAYLSSYPSGVHADDARAARSVKMEAVEVVGVGGRCVDALGAGPWPDLTPIILYSCHNSENQMWRYSQGRLIGVGGKCLDAAGGGDHPDGTPVILYACDGGPNQTWTYSHGQLIGIEGRCLDAIGVGPWPDMTPLILFSCHGGENQKWALVAR